MKKILLILLLIAIVGCSAQTEPEVLEGEMHIKAEDIVFEEETKEPVEEIKEEVKEATLSIEDAFTTNAKCEVTMDGNSVVLYIKDGKQRTEMTVDGQKMISIYTKEKAYTWVDGADEGMMIDIKKVEEMDIEDVETEITPGSIKSASQEIKCEKYDVDESLFTIPDIEFMDMLEMFESMVADMPQ